MATDTLIDQHKNWHVLTTVEKYWEDLEGLSDQERSLLTPYETRHVEGNLLVTAGITAMLTLLIGGGGTAFNNANTYLGVGDSTTAAAIGQTDLQAATNKLRKAMDATFPSVATNVLTAKATFATGDANWAWQEWALFNASSGGTMLNRKVESLGTKASGSWVLTVTVTIT
jgi:hypothetical protein